MYKEDVDVVVVVKVSRVPWCIFKCKSWLGFCFYFILRDGKVSGGVAGVINGWHFISSLVLSVEELQCLGVWRDSTYHYLVGKLNYQLAASNEDRYRCFIYEIVKGHTIVKLAQSGDATCNGLSSPVEGAKTMTFTKGACSS